MCSGLLPHSTLSLLSPTSYSLFGLVFPHRRSALFLFCLPSSCTAAVVKHRTMNRTWARVERERVLCGSKPEHTQNPSPISAHHTPVHCVERKVLSPPPLWEDFFPLKACWLLYDSALFLYGKANQEQPIGRS